MTLRCEILSTGDEVLTGQIVDTNAAFLADRMGSLGFEVARHTTVGDDRAALAAAFRELGAAADVVLCTGGLGPTVDDLTTEVVAEVLGVGLALDEPALARMQGLWASRGRPMPENNRKQAMIPEPAEVLPNPIGTAPGFTVKIGRASFFFMPGVPREMKRMLAEQVVPRLEKLRAVPEVFEVRIHRTFGLPESAVDQMLSGLEERVPGVKLGFRAHFPEIQVKLTVKGNPSFSLSASPNAITVARGSAGTSLITSKIAGGFAAPITFTASGQGGAQKVTFSPNPIKSPGSGTSTMTVQVGTNAALGAHLITVTGTGGSLTNTTTVTLTVTP